MAGHYEQRNKRILPRESGEMGYRWICDTHIFRLSKTKWCYICCWDSNGAPAICGLSSHLLLSTSRHPPGHAQNLPWPRKLKRLAKLSCTKISKRNGHAELIFGIHLKCANATIAPPSMKFPSVLLGCGG